MKRQKDRNKTKKVEALEKVKAKKSLGQHFLRSNAALSAIVAAGNITTEDTVVEVGPGEGVLTEKLLLLAGKVVAIEKDRSLVKLLQEKFEREIEAGKLELIAGDILDFDPSILNFYNVHTYKVIANIPYYITGAILRLFLETKTEPSLMVLLVQKEVAERSLGSLRSKQKESLLSISVKAYGTPRIAARVPRGAFVPPPTVDSAVLVIDGISRKHFSKINEKAFWTIVHAGFAHKRKVLMGNLSELASKEALETAFASVPIAFKIRAEDISLKDWLTLTHALSYVLKK